MSLIATRVQNWRINNPEFDRNMTRPSEYGALNLFVQQTESANSIISRELRDRALTSIGKTVQIPVINYDGGVTVSNTRSCTIPDNENTSALYTVAFATLSVGFSMVPALYDNNDITYMHDWSRKFEKVIRALVNQADIMAVATLEANKTQVFHDLLYYTQTANTLEIPWSMRDEIYGDLNPMFRANDYRRFLHVVGNAGIDSTIRKQAEWGTYNERNKQLEFAGKVFHFTNNIVNESGIFGTFFAVEDGNLAVLTRVEREAYRGTKANFHEWDVVNLPLLGLPVGTHYKTEVGDQSAVAGEASADLTCNLKEYFGFSVDIAFLVAYNSDPAIVANPIMKGEIAVSPLADPMARPVYVVPQP